MKNKIIYKYDTVIVKYSPTSSKYTVSDKGVVYLTTSSRKRAVDMAKAKVSYNKRFR